MLKILFKILIILSIIVAGFFLRIQPSRAEAPSIDPKLLTDPLFEKIGYCESKHILTAKNPHSTASGEFQFIRSSWEYYGKEYWGESWVSKDVFSTDNRELAWYVYNKYGTSPWYPSQHCWKGV